MTERRQRGRHAVEGRSSWATASARALVALISGVVLLVTGLSWGTVGSLDRDLNTADALDPNDRVDDGATDILLVGLDNRTDGRGEPLPLEVLRVLRTEMSEGRYTDTVILMRVPQDGGAAHLVSIPRDAMVSIPGAGRTEPLKAVFRIAQDEAAQSLRDRGFTNEEQAEREAKQEARRALVRTVGELTGVSIDHYAEMGLYGFFMVTKGIGGVEVCLNEPVSDPNSGADFPAGRQTLSGADALSFVRQRDGLPRGDLDRIVRQQVFLAATVNKLLSADTLTNPERLTELVETTRRAMVLDSSWDLLSFAQQMQSINAGAVSFATVPVVDVIEGEDGQIVTLDPAQVRGFVTGLIAPPDPVPEPADHQRAAPDPANAAPDSDSPSEVRSSAAAEVDPRGLPQPPITADGVPCVN